MENDCELLPIMLNRKTDRKRNSFIFAYQNVGRNVRKLSLTVAQIFIVNPTVQRLTVAAVGVWLEGYWMDVAD